MSHSLDLPAITVGSSPELLDPSVLDNEKVLGLLTVGNIGELLALEAAGGQTGTVASQAGGGTDR